VDGRDKKVVFLDRKSGALSGDDSEGALGEGDSGVAESWREAPIGFLGAKF
jgi:hypothetical protein